MTDRQTETGTTRLRELHHAATDLMSSADERTVYRRTVDTAESVLGFDFCSVFLRKDDEFEVVASSHHEIGKKIPVRNRVLDRTVQTGDSFLIRDIQTSSITIPIQDDFRSGVSVPVGEDAVLQATSSTTEYYEEIDLELAELLSVHAEAALEQVRSEKFIRNQKHKIEELHAVATELESCHTREELFELMREASQEIIGIEWCTLYVMEDEEFVVAMASELSPVEIGDRPFPKGKSKAREVLETGESLVVDDVQELDAGEPTTDRIRSGLQVPVGNVGVFNGAHEQRGMFDEDDLELAELLASSVAEAHERIVAQEQLRAQKLQLQNKNERLDQFASLVSHDLRNPLSVARIRTDLLSQEQADGHVKAIKNALDRMETIIDEMLTMARARQSVEPTSECELEEIVRMAWNAVPTEDIELESSVQRCTVEADRNQLLHVFENLFRNAIDHNDSPLMVRVGELDSNDGFYVEDTGRGIPETERETVFDLGYTTSQDGSGFGLGIVSDIVTAHGWTVTITESEEGGARFEITI